MAIFILKGFLISKAGIILDKAIIIHSCAYKITLKARNQGAVGISSPGKLHLLCSISAWTVNRPEYKTMDHK